MAINPKDLEYNEELVNKAIQEEKSEIKEQSIFKFKKRNFKKVIKDMLDDYRSK